MHETSASSADYDNDGDIAADAAKNFGAQSVVSSIRQLP